MDRLNGPPPDSNDSTEDSDADVEANGHEVLESAAFRTGDE